MLRKLWTALKWIGENLPIFLALAAAFWAGYILDDQASMHFFIIMAGFFMLLRELYEIGKYLKLIYEEELVNEEPRINTEDMPITSNELREIRIILERLVEDSNGNGGRHSDSTF